MLASSMALAESNRADYDIDNNGLIEINDFQDLDIIRNDELFRPRAGFGNVTLYGENIGCPLGPNGPNTGCYGYELASDLDFDTNGAGKFSELDDYYNNGRGWKSIRQITGATFEGNDHTIKNFVVDNRSNERSGLFGIIAESVVQNLHIEGTVSSSVNYEAGGIAGGLFHSRLVGSSFTGTVSAQNSTGGLIGSAGNSVILESYFNGNVFGQQMVGGLVGHGVDANGSLSITASFATGKVIGQSNVGGLVGLTDDSHINSSFATGLVVGLDNVGGLIGYAEVSGLINSYAINSVKANSNVGGLVGYSLGTNPQESHWAVDVSGQQYTERSEIFEPDNSTPVGGALLSEMLCPRQATEYNCSYAMNLYVDWDRRVNNQEKIYWDYGTGQQAPGLEINGRVYRDSDGDGSLDEDDVYPLDTDNDSHNNDSDQTPLHPLPLYR